MPNIDRVKLIHSCMNRVTMTKVEFIDRLLLASAAARTVAARQPYVNEDLPTESRFTLMKFAPTVDGKIQYLGGRFLSPEELIQLSASRAGSLLWVDGKVPGWINIGVVNCTAMFTEYEIFFSEKLLPANADTLPPDIYMEPGNKYAPFRIRGPSEGGWIERKTNP